MTTRERWIVYPLLFLALGSSMKSHLIHRFECRTLVASKIEIVDRHSRRQAVFQSTPDGGELSLISPVTGAQTTISSNSVFTQYVKTFHLNGRQLIKLPVPADALDPPIKIKGKQPTKKKPAPKE
ncbi:MAG: hypothetical protein IID44_01495 [Planctomycetes bacterium]|nr:hypothetical protein [Planctomycetota bacterium]